MSIISYYKPPNEQIQSKVFDILNNKKLEFIIMGDFNAKTTSCGADSNNTNGDILDNIIIDHNCLKVINKQPTHVNFNGQTSSIIDHCIISTKLHDKFNEFSVLEGEDMTSDHLPCLIIFQLNSNFKKKNIKYTSLFKRFNFKKTNWELFKQLLPTSLPAEYGSNIDKKDEFIVNGLNNAPVKSIPVFCQT